MSDLPVRRQAFQEDGHFYSPVVDTADVAARAAEIWPAAPEVQGIDFNAQSHRQVLAEYFPRFYPRYDYPELLNEGEDVRSFFTRNDQFSWLDSRSLFVLLQAWRPRRLIEVGSGFSTLVSADVNQRFLGGAMDLVCIEPYPRSFLKQKIDGVSRVVEQRVERVGLELFASLASGDVLFIDSSHVAKTGSDVNFLVFEVLPRLARGVRVHFHDIFLPHDYPPRWVISQNRSWNEQYVLRALLMHTTAFRILFGSAYAFHAFPELVRAALAHPRGHAFGGGSLWIERL